MSLTERSYEEKRNFIRMKVDTMVSFTRADSKERYEGRCRNLSGAGMLLETEKKLQLGDRLRVTVPSEGPDFSPLDAMVEVVRVDAIPNLHKFMCGVVIRKLSEQ
ncbi:MAG: PilZ domain-containing protein [Pseudomonadales bacterium]|nr:PilZ domain-containing protein [Pseudomonadales bacterium]